MHDMLNLALALVLLQPAPPLAPPPGVAPPPPPIAPPNSEPLTERRLLAIEQKVESIQREYWDNAILLEERLGSAIEQADRQVGRPVEIYARVVRVSEQRVHVRFFQDLGETRGPLIEFLDKPEGEYLGGTRLGSALVIGTPTLPVEFAQSLRRGDLLRIRGPLVSIDLSPRPEQRLRDGTRPERAVRAVIAAPRIEKVQPAPAPAVPTPRPPAPLPGAPIPLPALPPAPLPPPIPPLPAPVPR